MASAEREELEHQLDFIRASIQEIADRLKSERDPVKIADYKLLLKVLQSGERLLSAGKSRHDLAGEIAQWKEELSSPTIDSAPPVTLIEERRTPGEVFPSPRYPHEVLPRPFPVWPTVSRQVPKRQYVEEQVQSAEFCLTKLDAEIARFEREYSRLYELALRVLPRFKPDEIPKKLAAESLQMGNSVSTSGSPPVNNAATEPKSAIEVAQPVEPADTRNLIPQAEAPHFTHSGDYRKLGLDDATYTVTPDQAAIFRCLAQAYERGLAGVPKETLLAEVNSPTSRVGNFFQREGRKLRRDLIAYDKHTRLYRLRRKPILSRTN